jgi:hypothetical protein
MAAISLERGGERWENNLCPRPSPRLNTARHQKRNTASGRAAGCGARVLRLSAGGTGLRPEAGWVVREFSGL